MRADVKRVTQDLAYELEQFVRRAPEQWHLFQPNWPSDEIAMKEMNAMKETKQSRAPGG
jgi:KDO2-lipid IV(A) lauroyltransferase